MALVAEAGGHLDIDSAPGAGTTVTVRLPLVVAEALERMAGPPASLPDLRPAG